MKHKEWEKNLENIGVYYKITCTRAVYKPRMLKDVLNEAMPMYYDPKILY